jgi:ApaG protein
VVGEQPVLEAGQVFEYTSGAVIQDPIGAMEGTYTFRGHDGKFFEVQIPKFELMYPVVVH